MIRRRGRRVKQHEATSTKVGEDQGTQQSADAITLLSAVHRVGLFPTSISIFFIICECFIGLDGSRWR